jgi:hypothetical protein
MIPSTEIAGGLMMLTNERSPPPLEQDARMVQGGAASLTALERRLAPSCERVEPRQRVRADLRGLLSPAERTNSWPLAEISGDATPSGLQPRLRRAGWDPEAVLVIDEPGFLNKGRHARGTAGRLETCPMGVWLG